MLDHHEYRLQIDVFTVRSLPMARLAEYMAELAKLLGEQERVYFARLDPGSAVLVSVIESPALISVNERLTEVKNGVAPREAMQAYKALDTLLAKDDAVATLTGSTGAEIMAFPGRNRPQPMRYGPFREDGSLDGIIIRVGGRDETIPVLLQDAEGVEYRCQTTLDLSKKLALLYRAATVRGHGSGKWVREESGRWTLQQFDIASFEVLDDAPLTDVVSDLRAVQGAAWGKDPAFSNGLGLRREDGPSH